MHLINLKTNRIFGDWVPTNKPEIKYFCGTRATGQGPGPGPLSIDALWVKWYGYLSWWLHVGNQSRPTPPQLLLTLFAFLLVRTKPSRRVSWVWAWVLLRFPVIFFPHGVFYDRFFLAAVLTTMFVSGYQALGLSCCRVLWRRFLWKQRFCIYVFLHYCTLVLGQNMQNKPNGSMYWLPVV